MPAHTGGPEKRRTIVCGQLDCGRPATCIGVYEDCEADPAPACDECCGHGNEDGWCLGIPEYEARHGRWPAVPVGGGSAPPFVTCNVPAPAPDGAEDWCHLGRGHDGSHASFDMQWSDDANRIAEMALLAKPAELPPIRRCAERVSEPGDAIEDCGTVIGREVQCIACRGARCYVHCGCLSHYQGARTVSRGSNGKFEWCVWELEHGFRGQLFWHTEGGISLLGTHGGSSSEAVGAILLRNLEKIQAQHVRGDVVIGGASARTNEAAGEVVDHDPTDPEAELRRLDAKVVLLLENAKRQYEVSALAMQRQRLRMVDICVGWVRTTERTWRDLADDGEQNPRLVFQCKELHDQQVADLFFQIGQLFNGGES